LLAKWLRANFYASDHRPVPVEEYLVYENAICPALNSTEFFQTASKWNSTSLQPTLSPHRIIEPSTYRVLANATANAMVSLAVETATAGYGALVFCGSRHACQTNSVLISDAMPPPSDVDPELLDKRLDLLAELQSLPCGLDPVFQATIIKGVAFHREYLTHSQDSETWKI
jgi:DNA polymerase theta